MLPTNVWDAALSGALLFKLFADAHVESDILAWLYSQRQHCCCTDRHILRDRDHEQVLFPPALFTVHERRTSRSAATRRNA